MQVRDENGVGSEPGRRRSAPSGEMRHPIGEQWVGEQVDALLEH